MNEVVQITDAAKKVKDYEGYAITKNGVVYSLPRKGVKKPRLMKPIANMKADYLRVALSKNGKNELVYVHRLVAEAYIPNPLNKPMVNHKNGVKTDNRVENLEWVTGEENRLHAFELGLYPMQKIHPSQKKDVYDMVVKGVPVKKVAEIYGLKPNSVYTLVSRFRVAQLRLAA
ncbi:hypothetical protein GMSM_29700 [Geomonas sp. Red276]